MHCLLDLITNMEKHYLPNVKLGGRMLIGALQLYIAGRECCFNCSYFLKYFLFRNILKRKILFF
jgi:hypothetical protein